jgi:hypothetical protein
MTDSHSTWSTRSSPALLIACLVPLVVAANPAIAQGPATREVYQDFRNKRFPTDAFAPGGFDPASELKAENEGLRITLAAERGQHYLSEVFTTFPLTGDFEFTATFQILSAQPPVKGYGVGVNLTISTTTEPKKFGKLCRVLRAEEGSVYLAESWPPYQKRARKAEAMAGQLRLARVGAALYLLAAVDAGQEFQQIWEVADYGRDEIGYAGFQVSDSGEPGNPVQARLIDLRLRLGGIERDRLTAPASLPVPTPADDREQGGELPGWPLVTLFAGAGIAVLLAVVLVIVMRLRRRSAMQSTAPSDVGTHKEPTNAIAVTCPACGTKLKAKPESVGKKAKCPHCGEVVLLSHG